MTLLDRPGPPLARGSTSSAPLHQPTDIATVCSPSSTSCASDRHAGTMAPRAPPEPPPGLEKYAHLCASHGITVKAAPVRPRLHTSTSVPSLQPHVSTTQVYVNQQPTKGVQVPAKREPTMPSVQTLVRDMVLFLSLGPWFFLWSNSGKPSLTGLDALIQRTATSCIINTVSQIFCATHGRRARTPPISSRRLAEGSMRLFFKKPVIMSPTSPISSLRTLETRTSPSCSTRTPSRLTLWLSPSRKTPQAKVLGVWLYQSSKVCSDAFTSQDTDGHFLLSTHPQCRGQET